MKIDLNRMTKNFILSEAQRPKLVSMIVSLQEQMKQLEARTVREQRLYEMMNHLANEIRKAATRQSNEVKRLEEELNFLQEDKKDGK
jgi:type II secretory pathway component PulJ